MNKHTPGPWLAEKEAGDEWWFGGKGGMQIRIRPQDGKSWDSLAVLEASLAEGQADANARLIAAAPELLEALQDIMDTGFAGGPQGKRARAAIKKATGE